MIRVRFLFFSASIIFISTLSLYSATPRSLINRYAFSDEYLDSVRSCILLKQPHFYSLPNSFNLSNHPFLEFTYDSQIVASDLYSILSYENRAGENLPNAFLGSVITYNSRHLHGEIQFDFHTIRIHKALDFADSLNDVAFEQYNSKIEHITGSGSNKDFNFQAGYLEFYFYNISLLTGKYPLRWGPGYKGTLGLSGTTYSPFYYYLLQLEFSNFVHVSAFLSGLDDMYLFVNDTVPNADRFSAGQRIDFRIGKHVQLGVYELVDFNGTALLSRYANPVQLYYISTYLRGQGTSSGSRNNMMGGFDFNILADPLRIYGEFLNDDITVFDDNGSPNKFGFQLGSVWYGTGALQEAGFEYTHVSRWTYGHFLPGLNRHTYFGESRGWPWGNDMDCWHLRARLAMPKQIQLFTEVDWWIKGDGMLDEFHWDIPDSIRPDLDNVGDMQDYANDRHIVSLQLGASWKPVNWVNCELIWLPAVVDGEFENRVRVAAIVWVPATLKRKL